MQLNCLRRKKTLFLFLFLALLCFKTSWDVATKKVEIPVKQAEDDKPEHSESEHASVMPDVSTQTQVVPDGHNFEYLREITQRDEKVHEALDPHTGEKIFYTGGYVNVSVARRHTDGSIVTGCFTDFESIKSFLTNPDAPGHTHHSHSKPGVQR